MLRRIFSAVRRSWFVWAYLLVAGLALDALLVHFATALPGTVSIQASDQIQPSEFDIFSWDLWWVKHAAFELGVSPLYTNYLAYPFTSPLAGHTLVLLWGMLSAPFQALIGLIPTFNSILVFDFVAAGSLTYLFARRHIRHGALAWLAGLIFAFMPAMIHRASLGHLDKLSVFWLPLVLLTWDRTVETRRWTWAAITGLCLYLAWLTDFQQAMWAMLVLAPYAAYTGFIEPRGRSGAGEARRIGAAPAVRLSLITAAAFLLPAMVAPLPQLVEANRLNYPVADLQHAAYFAFPLQSFVRPDSDGDFSIGVVLPLLTLACIPFIGRDGRRWLWLGIALACFVLALGPWLDIGSARIPLPYQIVHGALGNQYRTPMRFATPGVLALALLVSSTLDSLVHRHHGRLSERALSAIAAAGLSAAIVLDYCLWQPFPITRMPDYQAYRDIAGQPGDFTVLEIPIGVRTGFAVVGRGEYLQYYQTVHGRPVPSGYLSRLPNEVMDYFYFDPMVGALTLSHALPDDADARLARLIDDWKVGYVILHRDMLEPGRVRAFGNLLDRLPGLERVGEEGPLVVYRARLP